MHLKGKIMTRRGRRLMPPADLTETEGASGVTQIQNENFARRLQQLMVERGLSQSDLARTIWGETTNADGRTVARNRDRISVYLKGKTVPDPVNLQKLAEALGVDPADLAPDVIGAAVERENPELSMTVVAGHSDKVYLRVNKLLPLQYAVKIVNVVEEADRFAKGLIKPDKSE